MKSFDKTSSVNFSLVQKIADRVKEWEKLSDSALRLRCGEMTAQEIRTVRAVLNSILGK